MTLSVGTLRLGEGAADLELTCEWWSGAAEPLTVSLRGHIVPDTFDGESQAFRRQVVVRPGRTETRTRITLREPRLWWTPDLGAPDLYRITVTPTGADGAQHSGVESTFGVRRLDRDEETLTYTLNGRRLFLRGVWYPFANLFPAAVTDAAYRRDVAMLCEAHCNHVMAFT